MLFRPLCLRTRSKCKKDKRRIHLQQSISNLFERPQQGERAVLVHVDLGGRKDPEDLLEFQELARSAGALSVGVLTTTRDKPNPKYFIGEGKITEIREY